MAAVNRVHIEALARWMDGQGLGSGPITAVTALKGGTQNILIRYSRAGQSYVLRRPPEKPRSNSNETMRREARMLRALAGTDVPHPQLVASCDTEDVLGVSFYLMKEVAGFNIGNGMPSLHTGSPALRREMGMNLVDAIAALGRLDYQASGLQGFGKPDNYLERQVGRWKKQLDSYRELANWPGPAALPNFERIGTWLEAHRPTHFKPGIIHGDYHLRNVIFSHAGPELLAIVDWELTTIGDPLIDLGGLIASWRNEAHPTTGALVIEPWHGFPTAPELVERYARGSDRDLSNIDWYTVLACFKLGIILEGTYARACAGLAAKETGDNLHAYAVTLLHRASDIVLRST
jgi:aminoglycoside phosphotransferase (APT) family kinase protein